MIFSELADTAARGLLTSADLVLDDGQDHAYDDVLVNVRSTISWFGKGGPYENFVGSDALCFAMNGMLRGIGRVEGPPLIPTGYQAQLIGGLTAFTASLSQVLAGELSNRTDPVAVETSIYEACLCFTDVGVVNFHNTSLTAPRMGINRYPPTYPLGVFPCRDGWLGVTVLTPSQWHSFCRLLDMNEFADIELFQSSVGRLQAIDVLEPVIREKLLEHSAEDLFYRGQNNAIPLARVPTMEQLFGVDQFVERHAFSKAKLPEGDELTVPSVSFRLFDTPPHFGGPVAALGEHNDMYARAAPRPAAPVRTVRKFAARPLEGAGGRRTTDALAGLRVVDLSMGWAGPLAARHMADMGAEVIKVESCERFDWWRSWEATPQWIADDGAEKSTAFNTVNRNKRNITLDLEDPEGRDLLLRLVAKANVVVENYSGGVLPKLKLGYEVFREANENIILLSMPAFGSTGPWSQFRAYGSTVEQSSGLPHLNGLAEDPPTMQHVAFGDAVGGLNGAAALLTALRHQARTGAGQFVDLSQVEGLFPLAAHGILHYAANGEAPARQGNISPVCAPHGVYPCRGEDSWIALQIFDEDQWRALQGEIGESVLCFGDVVDRHNQRAALDAAIGAWTARHDANQLMLRLQHVGIPAAAAYSPKEILDDPHLAARGFWQWLDRAVVGRQPNPSPPYRSSAEPFVIATPAPTLGQHNDDVLGGLLGLGDSDLTDLRERGIIGTRPRMPSKQK